MALIGVLALQGGVSEHCRMLNKLGCDTIEVRRPAQLAGLDGLVLPGGESSTLDRLIRTFDLQEPLRAAIGSGLPTLGTCAGLILLSARITDPAPDQQTLGLLPVEVQRNAFGAQAHSAEATLAWSGEAAPRVRAAFIRAPAITWADPQVELLAHFRDQAVAVRKAHVMAVAFHPELTGETAVHHEFLRAVHAREGHRE